MFCSGEAARAARAAADSRLDPRAADLIGLINRCVSESSQNTVIHVSTVIHVHCFFVGTPTDSITPIVSGCLRGTNAFFQQLHLCDGDPKAMGLVGFPGPHGLCAICCVQNALNVVRVKMCDDFTIGHE